MRFYWLVLGILCVWRMTHLLRAEDGPWDIIVRLRRATGEGFWGKLLDCFYCLSLWIAAPFAFVLGETLTEQLLLWPALSGGAILAERFKNPEQEPPPAPYIEDKEDENDMLRKNKTTVPRDNLDTFGS